MTTVVWDGTTLAADRLAVSGGMRRTVRKIHECGAYLYAGVGGLEDVLRIADWIRVGAKPEARPVIDEGGGWGLAVERATGRCFQVMGKHVVLAPLLDEKQADGSGRDFALSAMAMGMSAAKAVQFAARFDVGTGSEIDTVELPVKETSIAPTNSDGFACLHINKAAEGPR